MDKYVFQSYTNDQKNNVCLNATRLLQHDIDVKTNCNIEFESLQRIGSEFLLILNAKNTCDWHLINTIREIINDWVKTYRRLLLMELTELHDLHAGVITQSGFINTLIISRTKNDNTPHILINMENSI